MEYERMYAAGKKFMRRAVSIFIRHRHLRAGAICTAGIAVVSMLLNLIFPLPLDKIERGYSHAVVLQDGTVNYVGLSSYNTVRIHVPAERIPETVKKCFVAYEDRWFYFHPGINPAAVLRAFMQNIRHKSVVSGASTITMQIARMIEPKDRTMRSKLFEMFRAMQISLRYSKKEQLAVYLNMIPLGGNLEGIGAGAFYYFNKQPQALSFGEVATLIGIPRSPDFARPDKKPKNAEAVKRKVLARLLAYKAITPDAYASAMRTAVHDTKYHPAFTAPHITMKAVRERAHERVTVLTIDPVKQTICESLIRQERRNNQSHGVHNIGAIVVDNKTGKILVWIGGYDYENTKGGMIDAVTMKRSPGSTLKPFIYAEAIDAGIITPKTVIYDVKRYYGGYSVANYDKKYHGPVTAAAALASSLNSPAVSILSRLHRGSFSDLLGSLGYDDRSFSESIGLSIALGAKEISLFDLVRNYTAFSRGGESIDISYAERKARPKGKRLLSGEAAFLISEMLAEGTRLDLPRSWEFTLRHSRMAWKTGTSFGNYDALCVGYNADYTIGIWLGNADRTPSRSLVGVASAAPLLFKLFNAIAYDRDSWFVRPDSVKTRPVSAASGKIPTPYSKHIVNDYFIPGISSMETCGHYKLFYIDTATGLALVKTNGHAVREVIAEMYPPEAVVWAKEHLMSYRSPPSYSPDQIRYLNTDHTLPIRSPQRENIYFINRNIPIDRQKIPLIIEPFPDTETVYWFINGTLLFEGNAGGNFMLDPAVGVHTLLCIDDKGRSGSVTVEIRQIE